MARRIVSSFSKRLAQQSCHLSHSSHLPPHQIGPIHIYQPFHQIHKHSSHTYLTTTQKRFFSARSSPNQKKDLYEILGVPKSASQTDIKKAYRELAKKYHPDMHKGDKDISKKFAEITGAYEVLGNEEKRKIYDSYGQEGVDASEMGGHPGAGAGAGFADFGDIFSMFGNAKQSNKGRDQEINVTLSFREAMNGCEKELSYNAKATCQTCEGSGSKPGTKPTQCKNCKGKGQIFVGAGGFRVITNCQSCNGTGNVITSPCSNCHGSGSLTKRQSIKVNLPPGVDSGMTIRVSAQGHASDRPNGKPGDLYVQITVLPDPIFDRVGNDIHVWVPITMSQALLGETIKVPTLSGVSAEVKIPPGIQSGEQRVLKGRGVASHTGSGSGNQIIHFEIKIPQNLTPKQKELIEQFKAEEKSAPPPSATSLSGERVSTKEGRQSNESSSFGGGDDHNGFFSKFFQF